MPITTEATIFLAFMVAFFGPPAVAAVAYYSGVQNHESNTPGLIISAVLLILWVPLVAFAPSIIQTYFGS